MTAVITEAVDSLEAYIQRLLRRLDRLEAENAKLRTEVADLLRTSPARAGGMSEDAA